MVNSYISGLISRNAINSSENVSSDGGRATETEPHILSPRIRSQQPEPP